MDSDRETYFYPVKSLLSGRVHPDLPVTINAASSSLPPFNTELVHLPPLDPPATTTPQENKLSPQSEHPTNLRFEHLQDEHGNHVVVGPKGQIQRCEDEPIRTPGAIQAFGVLIAVQERGDALIVRHVSENSTEILGLSPHFLFSLRCFTDTFPEAQADILWDNIDSPGQGQGGPNDGSSESPNVFLVSGWGAPGSGSPDTHDGRVYWTCWCAAHHVVTNNSSTGSSEPSGLIILEFEWEKDIRTPLYPPLTSRPGYFADADPLLHAHFGASPLPSPEMLAVRRSSTVIGPVIDEDAWVPTADDIRESTTSYAKTLPGLERLRRISDSDPPSLDCTRPANPSRRRSHRMRQHTIANVGMMDVFAIMAQINEQLGAVTSLNIFLKVVVGILKDLTQFHRVLVYQFDETWNGQVVAELVDWNQTRDLYMGLHFPASDIPAQARALYTINKVRLLYDRAQETARIVVKNREDLEIPLDMTHCYLRAMSPVHIKYLANMGVRASMSVSITAFGTLWGLIACHSYGLHGMRVPFPIRQMLQNLSQSISRHVERLSYAQRLHTRRLVNTMVSTQHPTGYIVSTDGLLNLFDADCGILVVGEGAKILGLNQYSREILIMAEYLRLKKYSVIQASQAVTRDFSDLQLSNGLDTIAGLLLIPLSSQGADFIAFFRKGQPKQVKWAGNPHADDQADGAFLQPRKSFAIWAETVAGQSRPWTDEQLETAGVLALVYGKFIAVWRQKECALQTTRLKDLLLYNATHEVRTPLNHIINYLEMALDGPLDSETRENLSRSREASKCLLFTINDLLDLTRLESGNETSFHEPFDLSQNIEQATLLYRREAIRRKIDFKLELEKCPRRVIGDSKKIRTVIQNLTANSLKYTSRGSITVRCSTFTKRERPEDSPRTYAEIVVGDDGCGIPRSKLDLIFRQLEQVELLEQTKAGETSGMGMGLAVVARIVQQLGGQLRFNSNVGEGTQASFLLPLELPEQGNTPTPNSPKLSGGIENLVEALVCNRTSSPSQSSPDHIEDSNGPHSLLSLPDSASGNAELETPDVNISGNALKPPVPASAVGRIKLRILIVEDNDINRVILTKRLRIDGHDVVNATNGQECLDLVESDGAFDVILMDIQMPILGGFETSQRIRLNENSEIYRKASARESLHIHGHIPIFAISASLFERQYDELVHYGLDGWILKPIDFRRLRDILQGVIDPLARKRDVYHPGYNWEVGGWLKC